MPHRPVHRLRLLRGRLRLTTGGSRLDYAAAVRELTARGRFGVNLGLERIRRLMAELDHPDRRLRGALVGGTNGKGSVVALVRSVLGAAGHRVGCMPKPHLVSYRERITIDGEPISAERFAAAVEAVLPAIDRVTRQAGPPTEFEALTAAAIAELARSEVELAVIEVGLGGRLDATNVLDLGVAAITNVQHDHERTLGPTLAAIGVEKAAIVKAGNLAVTGASGRGLRPILDRCADLDVPLRRAGGRQPYRVTVRRSGWDGLTADATTPTGELRGLQIGLLGEHQAQNAAVALAVLDAMGEDAARRGAEWAVDPAAIRDGFAAARWPGRLELLHHRGRRILLDGAHNPAGARTLARALAGLGVERPRIVFGAMRGKRVADMLRALAPLRPRFVFTRVDEPGAHDPRALATTWRRIGDGRATVASDPAEALAVAESDPLVVAGSLYLVGAVRGIITGDGEEAGT